MKIVPLALAALLSLAAAPSHAEKADRSKPVNIEADRVTVDDKNKIHIFEGHVVLTQGTLTLRSDKLVVTQDLEGYQRGVATGGEGIGRYIMDVLMDGKSQFKRRFNKISKDED